MFSSLHLIPAISRGLVYVEFLLVRKKLSWNVLHRLNAFPWFPPNIFIAFLLILILLLLLLLPGKFRK